MRSSTLWLLGLLAAPVFADPLTIQITHENLEGVRRALDAQTAHISPPVFIPDVYVIDYVDEARNKQSVAIRINMLGGISQERVKRFLSTLSDIKTNVVKPVTRLSGAKESICARTYLTVVLPGSRKVRLADGVFPEAPSDMIVMGEKAHPCPN